MSLMAVKRLCFAGWIASLTLTSLPACTGIKPVAPWQKGDLARPEMTFDWDKLDSDFVEHTYSSKEASSGGAGVGGGGCGCN